MATSQVIPEELSVAEIDQCLCGQPGCLGHERVTDKDGNGRVLVPGFTSQQAVDASREEIVVFDHPLKPHVMQAVLEKLTASTDAK